MADKFSTALKANETDKALELITTNDFHFREMPIEWKRNCGFYAFINLNRKYFDYMSIMIWNRYLILIWRKMSNKKTDCINVGKIKLQVIPGHWSQISTVDSEIEEAQASWPDEAAKINANKKISRLFKRTRFSFLIIKILGESSFSRCVAKIQYPKMINPGIAIKIH